MTYTRRDFTRLALTAVPAARLIDAPLFAAMQGKPNSKVAGVQIGMNVPYNFGGRNMEAGQLLKNVVDLGLAASSCARSRSRPTWARPRR